MHSSIVGDNIETFMSCKFAAEEQIDLTKLNPDERKIYIRNPSLVHKTKEKLTPLMISVINDCEKIFYHLIECGISLDDQDDKGYTALHHAISIKDLHKARILIQYGASTKILTDNKYTPYDLATTKQLKLLLDPNAEITSEDKEEEESERSFESQSQGEKKPAVKRTKDATKEDKVIQKLNSMKNNENIDNKALNSQIYGTRRADSVFNRSLKSVFDYRNEKSRPLSKLSQTVIHEDKEEYKSDNDAIRSKISRTINATPVRMARNDMNGDNKPGSRKSALSVKRSVKGNFGTTDDYQKPFYLPDIKANYSEYSQDSKNFAIPKSLHSIKPYENPKSMINLARGRFKTPSRDKAKML